MPDSGLLPADRVAITVLVDNYTDILESPSTMVDQRPLYDPRRHLLAEHGLSCLIRVQGSGTEYRILLDTGLSGHCLAWNARQLGIPLAGIGAVVLSHGHYDHTGGLAVFFREAGCRVPLIAHPDAFLRRRRTIPGQGVIDQPSPDPDALEQDGADIRMRAGPSILADGFILVTGEVERRTGFEPGLPGGEICRDGAWIPDGIRDDQAVVISVKGKGLVVLAGCAHAGIINTVMYARKITGIDRVHAVLGGFHLSGKGSGPAITPTIAAMEEIAPAYLVPMHCTGREATNRLRDAMPERCILNTVGTSYFF